MCMLGNGSKERCDFDFGLQNLDSGIINLKITILIEEADHEKNFSFCFHSDFDVCLFNF